MSLRFLTSGGLYQLNISTRSPPMMRTGDITQIHHLPSFWDDSSDAKLRRYSQKTLPKRKPSRELLNTTQSSCSPPSSPSAADHEADKSFRESMSYVQSPIGQKAAATAAEQLPPPSSKFPASPDSIYSSSGTTATSSIFQIPSHGRSPISSNYSTQSLGRPHVPLSPAAAAATATSPSGRRSPGRTPPNPILKHVKRPSSTGTLKRDTESQEGAYGLRQEDVIYMTIVSKIAP